MDAAPPAPFAALLRRYRLAAGLSQEDLAGRAGLSVQAVSALERGLRRAPYRTTVDLLAEALALTSEERGQLQAAVSRLRHPAAPAARPNPARGSLPPPATSFVGREQEQAVILRLLASSRLLTLTGTGGIGKTRLATHIAATLASGVSGAEPPPGGGWGRGTNRRSYPTTGRSGAVRVPQFKDGIRLVELAPLTDPTLIPQAAAQALGIREAPGRSVLDTLTEALREQALLLLLDNCEHLLPAAGAFAETLLRACPGLRILATSREALGAIGETVWWVPSLALPAVAGPSAIGHRPSPDLAATRDAGGRTQDSDAVRLFVDRATAAQPAFALTDATAPAVATICRRLDGIPLALELAAARTRILTPAQIAARLDDRFRLLTGGNSAVPRHETLRAALDWSYDLLAAPEQRLLTRLSVFAGSCDIDAAEIVCADLPPRPPSLKGPSGRGAGGVGRDSLFDLLTSLTEKSLLVVEYRGEAARYRLLETVRQYAAEHLAASNETDAVQRRHADWARTLAEHAAPRLTGPEQATWLDRLETEHDNLRAVLQWSLDGRAALGLALAGALWRFWQVRGYLTEGRTWLDRLLAHGEGAPPSARAAALLGAGALAHDQGDYTSAVPYVEQSLALYQDTGESAAADALMLLGALAWRRSDYTTAAAHCEESLALARAADDRRLAARGLNLLGLIAMDQGRYPAAHDRFEEALTLARALGDLRTSAVLLSNLGLTAHRMDQFERARPYLEEAIALNRRLGNPTEIARNLITLAVVARSLEDIDVALHAAQEALALAEEIQNQNGITEALNQLTGIMRERGDLESARTYSVAHLETAREIRYPIQILAAVTEAAANARAAGDPDRALRLLAASEAYREAIGLAQHPGMQRIIEEHLTALRDLLDATTFATAWAEGTVMSPDEAISYALANTLRDA